METMDMIVENWSLIGDTYYHKYHYYDMEWKNISSNFKDYLYAHELHGGSIAVISKRHSNQELMVFSPSGKLLSRTPWKDNLVIGLFWSDKGKERIFLLEVSGQVSIYFHNGKYDKTIKMGDKVKEHRVKSFKFFSYQGTSLMVLTEWNELFYKTNIYQSDSNVIQIPNAKQSLVDPIIDWVVFKYWKSDDPIALFACKNSIIRLNKREDPRIASKDTPWYNQNSGIKKLAITMSGEKLAIALVNGTICIKKSDLTESISTCSFDFEIKDDDTVQMEWAGENFLVLYHQDYIHLMDTNHQSTSSIYLDEPLLFPEVDGVRLITASKHEFIQKIPHELEQLYQFSAESPAMLLFDAQRHLEKEMPEAVNFLELIRSKEGQIYTAVDICLKAAANCLDTKWQKVILRAVRLGRSYIPDYKSNEVEDIHKKLLLLYNLRLPCVSMPLTMNQLEVLTIQRLLDRLINRGYYPFVERICTQLRIEKDQGINRMLEHWAENYIQKNKDQDEYLLATKIINRLGNHPDFDFAKIALISCNLGKEILAEKLLDKEGRIRQQVQVFMKFKLDRALQRAIESGDSDLICDVVSVLNNKNEFVELIQNYPIAKVMYLENILKPSDTEYDKYRQLLGPDDSSVRQADLKLQEALKAETLSSAEDAIKSAQNHYKKANNEFMYQILDDERYLVRHMSTVDVTMPMHDYLSNLFEQKLYQKAEELKQKLKISDRQFYWTKLNICAKTDDWNEFNSTISKWSRKTPVSYYDIGEICAEYNNEVHLNKYMDKIELDKRVKLLVKMEKLQEAESLAKLLKNEYLIHYVAAFKLS